MALMKTPVDLSKDIDEWSSIVLIFSSREEMKVVSRAVRCHWKRRVRWEQGSHCCLALPLVLYLFLACVEFYNFLVLLETGNKAPAPRLDCTPQFQAGI